MTWSSFVTMALFSHRDIFISLLWTCHSGKIIDVKKSNLLQQKHPGFCYYDESKYLLGKRLIMLNLNVPNYTTLHIKGYFDWTVKSVVSSALIIRSGWCATFTWITNAVTFALHVSYSLACLYALYIVCDRWYKVSTPVNQPLLSVFISLCRNVSGQKKSARLDSLCPLLHFLLPSAQISYPHVDMG